jgi:hypothetical protein
MRQWFFTFGTAAAFFFLAPLPLLPQPLIFIFESNRAGEYARAKQMAVPLGGDFSVFSVIEGAFPLFLRPVG